jgi:hypothetical protein
MQLVEKNRTGQPWTCSGRPRAFAFYGARTRAIVGGWDKPGHDDWDLI